MLHQNTAEMLPSTELSSKAMERNKLCALQLCGETGEKRTLTYQVNSILNKFQGW